MMGGDGKDGPPMCDNGETPVCNDGSDPEMGEEGKPFCPSENDGAPKCEDGS